MENKKLRQISADYERVKRAFGSAQMMARYRPTNSGNRQRKAASAHGVPLTGGAVNQKSEISIDKQASAAYTNYIKNF